MLEIRAQEMSDTIDKIRTPGGIAGTIREIWSETKMEAAFLKNRVDELEEIVKRAILHGQSVAVPCYVATCPECGRQLFADSQQWESATGIPDRAGLAIECAGEDEIEHRCWQSDWQSVRDAVSDFFDAK